MSIYNTPLLFADLEIFPITESKPYIKSSAIFSDDKKYRYELTRIWDENKKPDIWVMLNPSIADDIKNDPTIRRCVNFSKDNDAGGIIVINLFAYIETHSSWLYPSLCSGVDTIGKDNYKYFEKCCISENRIICAWGNMPSGIKMPECKNLYSCTSLLCLGINKTGYPAHPLYVPRSTSFKKYELKGK